MVKNKKDMNVDKSRSSKKHPIGQRLVMGLLCVCLSVMSLPMEHYGYLVLAAQKQEIVMFTELPEEVRSQTVRTGTELEELNLPQTLEAVCRPLEESSPEEESIPEGTEPSAMPEGNELAGEPEGAFLSEEGMEVSDISEEIGLTEELEDAVLSEAGAEEKGTDISEAGTEEKRADISEAGTEEKGTDISEAETELESEGSELPVPEERPDGNQTETLTIEGVVWTSEPEYDKEAEGSYVFMPAIPESYCLAADVQLPRITVSVVQDEDGQTGEEENPDQDREITLTVNFYSGSQGNIETKTATITGDNISGTVETPELEEMEGWTRMGWSTDISGYEREVQAGTVLTLSENADYYGIYEKQVTLSYEEENDIDSREVKFCRANVHSTVTYDKPWFTLRPAPVRKGYIFQGWSTEPDGSAGPDGSAVLYSAKSMQQFDKDTTLYASWKEDTASYRVEHYLQEIEGDGYVLEKAETEQLSGMVGDMVEARAKEFPGFTENPEHGLRYASGKIMTDGGLVLQFYYDRNVYHVDFDLNGGSGSVPGSQDVRYGGLLQTVDAPERAGYNFKGWYLDKAGKQGKQWDFARTVEKNTAVESVTLYAKWADETAPVLEKASYENGHKNLLHWILRKDRLKIMVPIAEEGSGVRQAEYVLIPDKAAKGKETAQGVNICTPVYGAIGLPLGAVNAGGKISRTTKGRARVVTWNDKAMAEFTISEDFKGTVAMTAIDWAGNVSAEKILTADGSGVIVEDNAPDIRFVQDAKGQYDNVIEIGVDIRDNADGNITGGIASVSYQMDNGKEISLPGKAFREEIVESYWFTMKMSGEGTHSLCVKAVDNAGNSSVRQISVDIHGEDTLPGPEPKTGDGSHVEIYATASMIAGFSYLLLYFRDHGMTEQKKKELVSRLVGWANGKGGIRRVLALIAIFFVLAYYHSIGKSVPDECVCLYKKI